MRRSYAAVCIIVALVVATAVLHRSRRSDDSSAPETQQHTLAQTAATRETARARPSTVPATTSAGRIDAARIAAETDVLGQMANVAALTDPFGERRAYKLEEREGGRRVTLEPPPYTPEEIHLLTQAAHHASANDSLAIANALGQMKQWSNAIDVYRISLSQTTQEWFALNVEADIGTALVKLGHYDAAENILTTILNRLEYRQNDSSTFWVTAEQLAIMRREQGRYAEALAFMDMALRCRMCPNIRATMLSDRKLLEARLHQAGRTTNADGDQPARMP